MLDRQKRVRVLGRTIEDYRTYGTAGAAFLGDEVDGHLASKGTKVLLDLRNPHVVLIGGKRGGGKSYTMGVLLEELANVPDLLQQRVSVIVVDTLDVFSQMREPNTPQQELLTNWGLTPKGCSNVRIFVPRQLIRSMQKEGLTVTYDAELTLRPGELDVEDWLNLFDLDLSSPTGGYLARTIREAYDEIARTRGDDRVSELFTVKHLINAIQRKLDSGEDDQRRNVVEAALNHARKAEDLNLFDRSGPGIQDLARPGQVTILRVPSQGSGKVDVRRLIVGVVARKVYDAKVKRSLATTHDDSFPRVCWMFIDEAHNYLPGSGTVFSTAPLLQWIHEGRKPGLGLVLATQMPSHFHPSAISQADVVLTHKLVSGPDIRAFERCEISLSQEKLDVAAAISNLADRPGLALAVDREAADSPVCSLQIRPRLALHGGSTSTLFDKEDLPHLEPR